MAAADVYVPMLRHVWLLACSACWTGLPTATGVRAPDRPRACEIRDSDVTISGLAKLSVRGQAFAQQPGPFARFDVAFKQDVGRVKLENETFVLDGDLDLKELTVRPRDLAELRDGWIEVRSAVAKAATDDALRITVALPEGLEPKLVPFTVPCSGLTFAAPPDPIDTADLDVVEVPINTQLRPRPDGPAVSQVIGKADPDREGLRAIEAFVIEKRGSMTKIRVEGDNPVVAWVSSLALRAPTSDSLGGFGFGRTGIGRSQVSCTREVSLHVRIEGRTIRVGRIKKEIGFYLLADASADELAVDLGLAKPDVKAFIKRSEFQASCDY